MKKKNLWRMFWVCLFVASLIITATASYLKAPSTAAAAEEGLDYAVVKNIADFRKYIDNNYPASTQDIIESDWSGETPLYQFTLPSDGTLLVAVLSDQGYAKGMIYKDSAMTLPLPEAAGCDSSRDDIAAYELTAGTYYYKAVRWNGQNALNISTYLGFIPKTAEGVSYTEIQTQYDDSTDVIPEMCTGKEDFVASLKQQSAASEDSITTDWKGYSNVHSFSVKESGWLVVKPVCENDYINWELYSDRALMSCIFREKTVLSTGNEVYACYLNQGTYYYRGSRWNGTKTLSFQTYLGFVADAPRFSVVSNTLTADASAAQVTFQGEAGTIRVIAADYDPVIIDDRYWATQNRANVITGNTATIKKNGNYVARLETTDGLDIMIPFTVSGVVEKTILAPTASQFPQKTQAPLGAPSLQVTSAPPATTVTPGITTTSIRKKVYKIAVSKKKITLKVRRKKKIKYSVTKGYIGFVRMKTSNANVAVINNKAVVTARKQGKCKITFTLSNGKKAVVVVVVKKGK